LICSLLAAAVTIPWKTDSAVIVLHRAAGMAAPENTVPALEEAVRQGADAVEIDVRLTRDGHFVLFHDDWILRGPGPGTQIEDLRLQEVLRMDVGERWGPKWRGLRTPLLRDVFRFAKANQLGLYLDLKTPGIAPRVRRLAESEGVVPLLSDSDPAPPAWVSGWNYTSGGEEDISRIRAVIAAQKGPYRAMVDDARAFALVLGRRLDLRPLVKFRASALPPFGSSLPDLREQIRSGSMPSDRLLRIAAGSSDPNERLEAIWALGRVHRGPASRLGALADHRDPSDPAQDPSGMPYFATYLRTAVAGAIVRSRSPDRLDVLLRLAGSGKPFAAEGAAMALAAQGEPQDLTTLAKFLRPGPLHTKFGLNGSLSYLGRFGIAAAPLYVLALDAGGMEKRMAVFGLAALGSDAIPILRELVENDDATPIRRLGAAQALYWMTGRTAERARAGLAARVPPELQRVLTEERPWDTG
jgi:hypothetical protein